MKKATPTVVRGVMYYPIHFDRTMNGNTHNRCPGCEATNVGSTDLGDIRCATVSSSSDERCYKLIWKTGEAGLAAWTAQRLTE